MWTLILSLIAGLFWGLFWHLNFRSPVWNRWLWRDKPKQEVRNIIDNRTRRLTRPWWSEWWDTTYSWENKWKNRDNSQGPAFLFSTWILVGLTDAFHFFQSVFLALIGLASVVNDLDIGEGVWWTTLELVIVSSVISTGFTITFRGIQFLFKKSGHA